MRKLLFAIFLLPMLAWADRLGSLRSGADVLLSTQTATITTLTSSLTVTGVGGITSTYGIQSTGPLTVSSATTITNATASGTPGNVTTINTGDPNTVGLVVKGNTYTPAGVQPNTVSGLIWWFKADALSLNNNDPVSSWTDSSGVTAGAAQSDANKKPVYKTNQVNGKPAVVFDGSDDIMTGTFPALQNLNAALSMFVVVKTAVAANGGIANISDGPGVYNHGIYFGIESTKYLWRQDGAGGAAITLSDASYHILSGVNVSASSRNLQIDGGGRVTESAAQWWGVNPDRYVFGGTYSGSPYMLNGAIAEIMMYNRAVTDLERSNIESYLATKYNITTSANVYQASNLQQWQSSAGVVLSSTSAAGYQYAPRFGFNTLLDTTTAPSAQWLLGVNSAAELYISTGTGAGAWVKVGGQ